MSDDPYNAEVAFLRCPNCGGPFEEATAIVSHVCDACIRHRSRATRDGPSPPTEAEKLTGLARVHHLKALLRQEFYEWEKPAAPYPGWLRDQVRQTAADLRAEINRHRRETRQADIPSHYNPLPMFGLRVRPVRWNGIFLNLAKVGAGMFRIGPAVKLWSEVKL